MFDNSLESFTQAVQSRGVNFPLKVSHQFSWSFGCGGIPHVGMRVLSLQRPAFCQSPTMAKQDAPQGWPTPVWLGEVQRSAGLASHLRLRKVTLEAVYPSLTGKRAKCEGAYNVKSGEPCRTCQKAELPHAPGKLGSGLGFVDFFKVFVMIPFTACAKAPLYTQQSWDREINICSGSLS